MRLIHKAGVGLLLASAPLAGVGCVSTAPKMTSVPAAVHPPTRDELYSAALNAEQQRDYQRARDQYAALQRQSPQVAAYAHRMGVVCTHLGDHITASKYFEHARKLEPNNTALLTDMGYAAIVQKDYEGAEKLLQQAVKLRPDNSRAMNNLALAIGYQGRFEESLAAFRRINNESQSFANLGYIHAQRNEVGQAIECYERAVKVDSKNQVAIAALAQLTKPAPPAEINPAEKAATELAQRNAEKSATQQASATEDAPDFQQPLSNNRITKATAVRPRDRSWDEDEPPFFDEEESAPTIVAIEPSKTPNKVNDADHPLIVPDEIPVARRSTPAAQAQAADDSLAVSSRSTAASKSEIDWESEVVSPTKPLPPQPLIEESDDELANVFQEESGTAKLSDSDNEELTDIEWAREDQAALASAGSKAKQSELTDGLKGFCPVTIREERRLVAAHDEFVSEFQGQTYRLSSAEALAKFQENPELYVPVAGGLDVVAVRQGSAVVNGSLDYAVWYRHRLHMFSSPENLAAFRAAPKTFAPVP